MQTLYPMETCRILVADDDAAIARLLGTILERSGLHAEIVTSGKEALERLRAGRYHILVLDLMMPEVSGYDVIRELRGMQPRPFVVVMTALGKPSEIELDPAVVSVKIGKPFDIHEFGALLSDIARRLVLARSCAVTPAESATASAAELRG